jgi:hypothetical protein
MKLHTAAAIAALTGLVAGTLLTAIVAAGPVALSTVAFFSNDQYTDVAEEDANMIADLEAGGHTVVLVEELTAAAFTEALTDANALVIPENGGFYDDLPADAATVISDWVEAGGRLVLADASNASEGLTELFGFSTQDTSGCSEEDDPCELTEAAADTEFADGPADLQGVNATGSIISSTLPAGSTVIYEGPGSAQAGSAASPAGEDVAVTPVAAVPVEDGVVIALGWDWYPDADGGADAVAASAEDEADWATVLDFAVSQPEVTASSPAAGALDLTMDSPSTQPVFVRLVINGTEHVVVIAAKTTSASFDVGGAATVEWDVPGWGIGEGTVEVAGATAAPPAEPAPAAPTFTG